MSTRKPKAEVYFSADVESDGPIPGFSEYSMLSFGVTPAAVRNPDGTITVLDSGRQSFYRELKPISDNFVPAAVAVSGLDREQLKADGADPAAAMTEAAAWIRTTADGYNARPVFAAYPLGYDWMFLYWYLTKFAEGGSPFGHSGHLDMKSYYAAKADAPIGESVKRRMPRHLLGKGRHTHHALDDAIEQGQMCANLLTWTPEVSR